MTNRGREFAGARVSCGAWLAILLMTAPTFAAGGTSHVTSLGQPVLPETHWPEGVAALLNDPTRADGWNPWFTGWPNDVKHYEFEVKNAEQLNRLIGRFAAIESDRLRILLSPAKESRGIGWMSQLPEGNNTPVLFSIGDQHRIDQWFNPLGDGEFGAMKFEHVPLAVGPTLTLYVRNEAIDLNRLQIPGNIDVSAGNGPGMFAEWNLKRPDERGVRKPAAQEKAPDTEAQRTTEQIHAFLQQRARARESNAQ